MSARPASPPPSLQTAQALVGALTDLGVKHVVLAPGSRSAPLALVLAAAEAEGRLSLRVVLDERSAGFIALGLARAGLLGGHRLPAAVVTTSGTAVANLHPAVAEADAAGVPLLVVSADRPHELVGTGANQTTEQTRLFGTAMRAVADLPADLATGLGQDGARQAVCGQVRRACLAAQGSLTNDPGPAQVNVRLRPPLAPPDPDPGWLRSGPPAPAGPHAGKPAPTYVIREHVRLAPALCPQPGTTSPRPERGLVVAGDSPGPTAALARPLAERMGWPLLAEPTSGARGGPNALPRYAELLATPAGQDLAAQAEHLVVLGHPSLSRPVSALLGRTDLPVDVISPTARWVDVAGAATSVTLTCAGASPDPQAGATELATTLGLGQGPQEWLGQWRAALGTLPPLRQDGTGLSADQVAVAVWQATCAGGPQLVLGSSMTIRRLDSWAQPPQGQAPHPVASRGLAGIDGTLATALGLSLGLGQPVRAVVGDLTFLHDAMSLGQGVLEAGADVQVVVVDDAGGAVFSTLEYPAATSGQDFARCLSTPQATDISALATALGARVSAPKSRTELDALLAAPVQGLSVLHVRVQDEP